MKKFIVSILIVIASCFMLTACAKIPDRVTPVEDDTARFQYIGQNKVNTNGTDHTYDIVQFYLDNETSIVYIVMINRAGRGTGAGFTPLIDIDGTYVTYDEFIAED